ncbi:polysaccharide deacetylase family protein [candidate division KSB1 bacterium]|nr:polysaccharide deacetylase family protein [candidate division KSB1 bacterium]
MLIINPSFTRHLAPWTIWKGDSKNRTVYLTFDDGPHPQYTPEVLKILKDYDATAAFFLTGENIVRHPGLVERIHSEGHVIGNHGFSHMNLAFKKRQVVFGEIERTDQAIRQITGSPSRFFRPPYGRFDFRFRKYMKQFDYRLVNWSLLTEDFREHPPEFLLKRVMAHVHPGAIILMHDGLPTTPILIQILPEILNSLKKKHYRFVSLMELE